MKKEQLIPGRVYFYYKHYMYWKKEYISGNNISYLNEDLDTVRIGNFHLFYQFKEVDEKTSRIVKEKLGIAQDKDGPVPAIPETIVETYSIY